MSFEDLNVNAVYDIFEEGSVRSVFSESQGDEGLTWAQAVCGGVSADCVDRHSRLGIFLVASSFRES